MNIFIQIEASVTLHKMCLLSFYPAVLVYLKLDYCDEGLALEKSALKYSTLLLINKFITKSHNKNSNINTGVTGERNRIFVKKFLSSFTRIGVSVWNSIPLSVKTLNKSNFCKKNKISTP